MLSKDLMEALHFASTLSFWRMTFLWTYSLIISYIRLFTQSMTQKSVYHHCAVSPLPPVTSSAPGKTSGRRLPICIITGATSGLGAAAALALSRKGYCVVLGKWWTLIKLGPLTVGEDAGAELEDGECRDGVCRLD